VSQNPNDPGKNGKVKREASLASVVEFCKKKNIPFIDEEGRYYKLKQFNQASKVYQTFLNKCFETKRPDEFEVGARLLAEPIPQSHIKRDQGNKVRYEPTPPQDASNQELYLP
jgi:hypothetical protein